jgi:ribonuclease-3
MSVWISWRFIAGAWLLMSISSSIARTTTRADLAKIKSVVVSEDTLAKVARNLNIGSFSPYGKGRGVQRRPRARFYPRQPRWRPLSALLPGFGELKATRDFVLNLLKRDIERIDNLTYHVTPKTTLQEYVQKKYKDRPIYQGGQRKGA